MYYPIQIPYILSREFSEAIRYSEEVVPYLKDFVVCFWEMRAFSKEKKIVENIIITDGCIDLVADYGGKQLGFAGMNKTEFHYKIDLPSQSFGARLKPGAFYAITKIPALKAMNTFLPVNAVFKDFDTNYFFALPFDEAKEFLKDYIEKLIQHKPSDGFLTLFDNLAEDIPVSAAELYKKLNFSPRQSQRLFLKNFGLTPQLALCILRFQKCLSALTFGKLNQKDLLSLVNYYDQAHLINDFKRNIGLTPFELMKKYN